MSKHFLDDPINKGLFQIPCLAAGKSVGKTPMAGGIVNLVCGRITATQRYRELYPVLIKSISQTGRNSIISKFLLNELAQTTNFGARRANFKRYYISNPFGWKKLPANPKNIMYGFW